MPDSDSWQQQIVDPPPDQDDASAWAKWAVEFLDQLCEVLAKWRESWTMIKVPIPRRGGGVYTDYVEHVMGPTMYSKLVISDPPSGFRRAAPLLDECSGAVQRFADTSEWVFDPPEKANEVAEDLLQVAQQMKHAHYEGISQHRIEELSRFVKMATRRRLPVQGLGDPPHADSDPLDLAPRAKPTGGGRRLTESEARKRLEVLGKWHKARDAGISQKDFCRDNNLSLKKLTTYINWSAQRQRRIN